MFPYTKGLISNFMKLRPFSYIVVFVVIFLLLIVQILSFLIKPQNPSYSDTLKIGFLGNISLFNPYPLETLIDPLSTSDRFLNKILLDRLIDFDQNGNLTNNLASDFNASTDFKTFTFNLKKIDWSDGYPLNADDILKSFSLIKSEINGLYFTSLKDVQIKKTGPMQIEFDLNKGNSFFPETLIWPILPSHIFKTSDSYEDQIKNMDFRFKPVTTSQWVVSIHSSNSLILSKNSNYNRESAKFNQLVFNSYENKVDLEQAVSSNDINLYLINENQKINQIDLKVAPVNIIRQHYGIYFNFSENAPSWEKDQGIRQALSYAISKTDILSGTYGDVVGPLPVVSPYFYPDINKYSYDPIKADQLLVKSGYILNNGLRIKDNVPLKINISVQKNTARTNTARQIQNNWQQLGIQVEINYVEDTNTIDGILLKNNFATSIILPKKFDVALYGIETPPGWDRFSLWHSVDTKNVNTYSNNIGEYKNTKIDINLENSRLESDQNKRILDFIKFQKNLNEDVPIIYLYNPNVYIVYSSRIENFTIKSMNSSEDFVTNLYNLKVRK